MAYDSDSSTSIDAKAGAQQTVQRFCEEWALVSSRTKSSDLISDSPPETYHRTDIFEVCQYGDVPALQNLLAQGLDLHRRSLEVVLLVRNSEMQIRFPSSKNKNNFQELGDSLLQIAAHYGHAEIAGILLEHGADSSANGHWALSLASNRGHFKIMDLLSERDAPLERLTAKQRQKYADYKQKKAAIKEGLRGIFKADNWVGQVPEMVQLWGAVPKDLRTDIDFSHILAQTRRKSLKENKPRIKFTK
jgi:hypothetical protein